MTNTTYCHITNNTKKRAKRRNRKNTIHKIINIISGIISFVALGIIITFILLIDSLPLKETYILGRISIFSILWLLFIGFKKGILN